MLPTDQHLPKPCQNVYPSCCPDRIYSSLYHIKITPKLCKDQYQPTRQTWRKGHLQTPMLLHAYLPILSNGHKKQKLHANENNPAIRKITEMLLIKQHNPPLNDINNLINYINITYNGISGIPLKMPAPPV